MNDSNKKPLSTSGGKTKKKSQSFPNPLESIREGSMDFVRTAQNQIFGPRRNFSGEISQGSSIEFNQVLSGEQKEKEKLQKQLIYERRIRDEEKIYIERKTNELRLQIQSIHAELTKVAHETPQLVQEVQIASFQVPVDSSQYELYFLERLFEFIKSFREKIHDASVWLHRTNKRAQKKNVWGTNYKKYGAKYLLSKEHYLSRSAG